MGKSVLHFVLPREEGFLSQAVFFGKAIYSPVAAPLALAAVTPEDEWDLLLSDESIEAVDYDKPCDLVAISIMTVYARRGYRIADEFRRRGKVVVIGGVHASFLPFEALEHADAVVIGEAEPVWPQVLSDAREGRLQGIYKASEWYDLREMQAPKWELLKRNKYIVANFVQTSRGCPHECNFCCEKGMNGNRYRFRPIQDILSEIKALPDREIGIYDADIFSRPARAHELLTAMAPLGKRWQGAVSSRLAENDELLRAARKSGCYMLNIGFESISRQSLAESNKGFNQPDRYKALVKKIHSHGMMVLALCIFGFDSDDESVFEKTSQFWIEAGADACAFSVLTPYPGTPLYHQLHAEGRITSYDWSRYDQSDVVFEPKRMSQETLRAGFGYAYEKFYSWRSLAGRFPCTGKRDRLSWTATNAIMRKFNLKEGKKNRVARDDTSPPEGKFAAHVQPEAPGIPLLERTGGGQEKLYPWGKSALAETGSGSCSLDSR